MLGARGPTCREDSEDYGTGSGGESGKAAYYEEVYESEYDDATDDYDDSYAGAADTDGDGVLDAEDDCPRVAGDGANGCPYDGDAAGSVTVPTDPDDVVLTTLYSATRFDADAEVRITAESGDRARHAIVPDTGGEVEAAHLVVSAFAGEEVEVSVAASGATATVEYFTVYEDADGDGLVDAFERGEHYDPETGIEFSTDPHLNDTDGDGLADGEEVEAAFEGYEWTVGDVQSDPALADTDGDGVDDHDELEVWETDPLDVDTSGDGFNDLVDPAPTENSTPPELTARSDAWSDYVLLQADHLSGVDSIQAEAYFDPRSPTTGAYWSNDSASVTRLDEGSNEGLSEEYPVSDEDVALVELGNHGPFSEEPRKVRLTIRQGSFETHYVIRVSEEDPVVAQGLFGIAAGSLAIPLDGEAGFVVLAGLATLVLAADYAINHGGDLVTGPELESAALGSSATQEKELHSWQHPEKDVEITLPSGNTREHPELDREQPVGWDQVKELPGIEQPEDVGEVIEGGEELPGRGEYDLIIGDNPNGLGWIGFRIYDRMILWAGQLIEDPTGHKVDIDRTDRHPVDRQDHATYNEIVEAIRNPDQIWENSVPHGVERHYIAQIGGKWVIVRVYWEGSKWTVSTSVKYDSRSEVKDYIKERGLTNRVYGNPL